MDERFHAIASREGAKLRAEHPGIAIKVPRSELLPGPAYAVSLDIRGEEFQELVAGIAAATPEQALEAAFHEAARRLRRRAERHAGGMRVVLACAVPDKSMETAS